MKMRFLRLSKIRPANWIDVLRAYWHLSEARLHMMRTPPPDLLGMENRIVSNDASIAPLDIRIIRRRTKLIDLAGSFPFSWAQCLQRSLALRAWLRRQGIDVTLTIGVRKSNGSLEAHAWLEYAGIVINDSQNVREEYSTLTAAKPGEKSELSSSVLEWTG